MKIREINNRNVKQAAEAGLRNLLEESSYHSVRVGNLAGGISYVQKGDSAYVFGLSHLDSQFMGKLNELRREKRINRIYLEAGLHEMWHWGSKGFMRASPAQEKIFESMVGREIPKREGIICLVKTRH